MYQIRYASYLICSLIGGIIFQKLLPQTDMFMNATWLMSGNILFEILQWRYDLNTEEEE